MVQWSEEQLSNPGDVRSNLSVCTELFTFFYVGGGGEKCMVDFQLANQFSLFQ